MSENVSNHIHKTSKKRKKALWIVLATSVLVLIGLIFYALFRRPVVESVTHEAGTFINIEEFLINERIQGEFVTNIEEIGISDLGEYTIQIQVKDKVYSCIMTIVDTLPPSGSALSPETLEEILPLPEDCVVNIEDATEVTVSYKEVPDVNKAGNVDTVILLQDKGGNVTEIPVTIIVLADTEAPVIEGAVDLSIDEGMTLEYLEGIAVTDNKDENPSLIVDDSQVDLNQGGEYEAVYIATDKAGNIAKQPIKVIVIPDVLAPVIEGTQDITVEVGGSISYRKGVTVTDDKDENPTLTIDNSQVDLETPGIYEVIYTATDRKGNASTATIQVTVKSLETLAMEQEVYEKAADILARITDESMTDMEKAFAIYRWTLTSIGYTGSSDKSDWIKGAYQAFKNRSGDCYTYFAAAKALYNVAGIENVDIVKSDTSRSSHYWSLINLGDGWYHVDCTPRSGSGDNFFMVTDAELEAYSSLHRNSHIFDGSLYPERATESVQHMVNYSNGTLNQ
ncbi:MAG: DUF5011 domain-containing protein [Lachnospiraceae bacterium]|nr:DUF5011 domain-containing protein [Lachnospiraceae bacterium]